MWKLYLVFNKSVNTVRNRPLKRYDKTTAIMSSLKVVLRARTVYVLNTQPSFQLRTTVYTIVGAPYVYPSDTVVSLH